MLFHRPQVGKNFKNNAVAAGGNHKIDRSMLTGERAGRDRCHAPARCTLNNLPLMFTSTKEKPVWVDAPINFLEFQPHPVYNFIRRTGTKSKAGPRYWQISQKCYYWGKLTNFGKNACNLKKLLMNLLWPSLIDSVSKGTSSMVRPFQYVVFS